MSMTKSQMLELARLAQTPEGQALLAAAPAATPAPVSQHITSGPVAVQAPKAPKQVAGDQGLTVTIAGQSFITSPYRTFASGNTGWNLTGKAIVDGKRVQVSGNLIVLKEK